MPGAIDIAIVSFDRFIHGDDKDRRAVAEQLYNAFSTVGWVYIKDHGIPQERVDEIFCLVRRCKVEHQDVNQLMMTRPKRSSTNLCRKSFDGDFKMQS